MTIMHLSVVSTGGGGNAGQQGNFIDNHNPRLGNLIAAAPRMGGFLTMSQKWLFLFYVLFCDISKQYGRFTAIVNTHFPTMADIQYRTSCELLKLLKKAEDWELGWGVSRYLDFISRTFFRTLTKSSTSIHSVDFNVVEKPVVQQETCPDCIMSR